MKNFFIIFVAIATCLAALLGFFSAIWFLTMPIATLTVWQHIGGAFVCGLLATGLSFFVYHDFLTIKRMFKK